MVLSPAEKQKAYRQRKKDAKKKASDIAMRHLSRTFSQYVEETDNLSDFELCLAIAGIEAPSFEDERGPEEFVLNDAMHNVENPFSGTEGAIGRAEVIIGSLLDAAMELATVVNRYKRDEIEARLRELEGNDCSDPVAATQEIAMLRRVRDQLGKQVRYPLPMWKVTEA